MIVQGDLDVDNNMANATIALEKANVAYHYAIWYYVLKYDGIN
ncbi:hypothetical protein [Prevotella micans]|nr:hypothetical protein [Prevotella micans]